MLIGVDLLVGIPRLLLLLPSNRHFFARLVRGTENRLPEEGTEAAAVTLGEPPELDDAGVSPPTISEVRRPGLGPADSQSAKGRIFAARDLVNLPPPVRATGEA